MTTETQLTTPDFVSQDTNQDNSAPTSETYAALSAAYAWFNTKLFGGGLPGCLWTYRHHGKAQGYFSPKRFSTADGRKTDEIALNPKYILSTPLTEELSVVVHEMVHQAQHCFGKPSRNGYHNKQWGAGMKAVGLYPSATGRPGGRETGQQMSHFIMPDGPFSVTCAELLSSGFTLPYGDIAKDKERKPSWVVKYTCPRCSVWARANPDVRITCADCALPMAA